MFAVITRRARKNNISWKIGKLGIQSVYSKIRRMLGASFVSFSDPGLVLAC